MAFRFNYTNNSEKIYGTVFDDYIFAYGGNDTVRAGKGNDTVRGGSGRDTIYGDSGNDVLYGEDDNDTIYGGSGRDFIDGGDDNDKLYGDSGNDTLRGGEGNDHLFGGADRDTLLGGSGHDSLYAGNGYDFLSGGTGDDLLSMKHSAAPTYFGVDASAGYYDGGEGIDTLELEQVFAPLDGESFHGWYVNLEMEYGYINSFSQYGLSTFKNIENVIGSSNDDYIVGDANANELTGEQGNDYLYGKGGSDVIDGGSGNDRIYGGSHSDELSGGSGADRIYGGSGDDIVSGGTGRDIMYGGSGNDTVDYSYATSNWYIDLGANFAVNGVELMETVNSFENVIGGRGNDVIFGTSGDNQIEGNRGNDQLTGRGGNDTFVFDDNWGNDTIIDFGNGNDVIDLSAVAGIRDMSDLDFSNVYEQGVGGSFRQTGIEISFGDNSIVLEGVTMNDISADDFVF